ncbi:type II secretion system major pseudopilin GspG [soil metagenome]
MKTMPRNRRAQGFTLIEMIAVIALIAAIAALVGGKIISNQKRAQWNLAKTQMQNLANEVDQYQSDVGRYPESLQQLLAAPGDADGWLGPYAKANDLKDPWHRDISYSASGDNGFELRSLGADGKPGGDGADKDLVAPTP